MVAISSGGLTLRRGLVVFQFAIAQVLIIGMLVVVEPDELFKNTSMGFTKDHILTVPIPGDSAGRARINYLRSELLRQPGITDVALPSPVRLTMATGAPILNSTIVPGTPHLKPT